MEVLFTKDYWLLWAVLLGLALFLPVRQLIWVLFVRRAERSGPIESDQRQSLKRRAALTSALLSFIFAVIYSQHLFKDGP